MLAPLGGVCAPRDWSNWMETSNSSPEAERRAPGAPSLHPRSARTLLALAGAALTFATTLPARATGTDAASTDGKGIAAGILLGAETVVLAEAALGVRPGWAYLVGAGVGAVGGGVGGYFLEDHISPKTATVLLASGLVLAVPATIAALSASAYEPPRDYVQDTAPEDEPVDAVPQGASAPRRPTLSLVVPPSLIGVDEGRWSVGVPAVSLLDVWSPEDRLTYGLSRETELRVPVLAMRF